MSVLVIDNYDSFVHNLARYFRVLGATTQVVRNDALTVSEVLASNYTHVVLSPGPCSPDEAGICVELVEKAAGKLPILGVCLGHQAIAQAFGAKVVRAHSPMHGKASIIHQHEPGGVFEGLPQSFEVGRYHSLMVAQDDFPRVLSINALTEDGTIMALAHKRYPIWGVQFHPESVLTQFGSRMIKNFLSLNTFDKNTNHNIHSQDLVVE